jgi:hypothetical protein
MLFARKKYTRHPDRIFRTDALKLRAICDDVLDVQREGVTGVVVAHFDQTTKIVGAAMDELNIQVPIIPSQQLDQVDKRSLVGDGVFILVAEHYPLPVKDEAVIEFAADLASVPELRWYCSLEEPLFKVFGGGNIIRMLEQLGLGDDCIENAMVDKSIAAAQKKIEKQSVGDQGAGSAVEWFFHNCPSARAALDEEPPLH